MRNRWIGTATFVALAVGVAWAKGGKAPPPAAAKPAMLVSVTDTAGKPVAGAEVAVLDIEADGWTNWRRVGAVTDAKGVATFTSSFDPVCLLAWTDTDAGVIGNVPLQRPPATLTVMISAGLRLAGRILGPDGKPAAGARCRVRAPDTNEWHHFDAEVASDGAIKLPTIPRELVMNADSVLEFTATGMPLMSRRLADCADGKPLELTFSAPRRVKGRLVGEDGRPVVGGEIHTADWLYGPQTAADAKGTFDFGPLKADVRRIHVVSTSHADFAATVPPGDGVVDVGDVTLPVGAPVEIRVVEKDGMKIRRALVALQAADGFRVAKIDGAGPAFAFPHVGGDQYTVDVYVHELEGAMGWRHVRRDGVLAGCSPIEITMPSGLVIKLTDAAGKPFPANEARVSCDCPAMKEPWAENFMTVHGPAFSEIRFGPMPESDDMTVTVTVKGHEPVELTGVKIDKLGCGAVTVKITK